MFSQSDHWITLPLEEWEKLHRKIEDLEIELQTLREELAKEREENG